MYVFALFVLATRSPLSVSRSRGPWKGYGKFATAAIVIFLVSCGLAAGWLLPIVTLPTPTGPYNVGIIDRSLIDEDRGRRLMVSVWYPAAKAGTPAPLTHYPDEVAAGLGYLAGIPGFPFQYLRYFTLSATEGAPIVADSAPFFNGIFVLAAFCRGHQE